MGENAPMNANEKIIAQHEPNWFTTVDSEYYNGEKVWDSHPPRWCIVKREDGSCLVHQKGIPDEIFPNLDAALDNCGVNRF